ncbi:MAG: transcription elongation factor GreA [Oscillospiraceae bacterium]|nr:transcription elongation factor GreA [Oscillospiraceae bacterium]
MANEITKAGYEKLKAMLHELKTEGRADVAEKLKVARSFGDLSENSEYDEAKSEQARLEASIRDIEYKLANAVIISDAESNNTDVIHIGSVVTIKETVRGAAERTYTVTSSAEANSREGKISDESPVGKALIGHKVGDKVEVEAPKGILTFKVVKIDVEH